MTELNAAAAKLAAALAGKSDGYNRPLRGKVWTPPGEKGREFVRVYVSGGAKAHGYVEFTPAGVLCSFLAQRTFLEKLVAELAAA